MGSFFYLFRFNCILPQRLIRERIMMRFLTWVLCILFSNITLQAEGEIIIDNFSSYSILSDSLQPDSVEKVFTVVDIAPTFKGCENIENEKERKICSDKKLFKFIGKNLKYPESALQNDLVGKVIIRFVISKEGEIKNAEILKELGEGTGEEALRVVKSMPLWTPGKKDGNVVSTSFTLPIRFEMNNLQTSILWNKIELEGLTKNDPKKGYSSTGKISLQQLQEILTPKQKGLPIQLNYLDKKNYQSQYFISIGKTGKKYEMQYDINNTPIKKKILKKAKLGDNIFFYTYDYKKTFLVLTVE